MLRVQRVELRPPRTVGLDQPLTGQHVQDAPRTLRCEPGRRSQLRRRLRRPVRGQGSQDTHVARAAEQRRQRMPEVALGLGGRGHRKKVRVSLEKVNFPSTDPPLRAKTADWTGTR
ncbi:hypothetical protein ISF6_2640 [Piscinibacter sakaiensis]|uniref:Uncharacterized protein n=1 Tax=Piscinibacter sakaiensis TaxID=1547922 RepID=A0A0K8P3J9_PISS1|nr:hypothetical protein ISF6_2640 [Piscinibacter sakaiensis]